MNLKMKYYSTLIMSVKRSSIGGVNNNAKFYLLLSIFDGIEKHLINDNRIFFSEKLADIYKSTSERYEQNKNVTPMQYPFFHLKNDEFFYLTFKFHNIIFRKTVIAKFIRDNIEYASFDNALWNLLQDTENRNYYKELIIEKFLRQKDKYLW